MLSAIFHLSLNVQIAQSFNVGLCIVCLIKRVDRGSYLTSLQCLPPKLPSEGAQTPKQNSSTEVTINIHLFQMNVSRLTVCSVLTEEDITCIQHDGYTTDYMNGPWDLVQYWPDHDFEDDFAYSDGLRYLEFLSVRYHILDVINTASPTT